MGCWRYYSHQSGLKIATSAHISVSRNSWTKFRQVQAHDSKKKTKNKTADIQKSRFSCKPAQSLSTADIQQRANSQTHEQESQKHEGRYATGWKVLRNGWMFEVQAVALRELVVKERERKTSSVCRLPQNRRRVREGERGEARRQRGRWSEPSASEWQQQRRTEGEDGRVWSDSRNLSSCCVR